MKRYKSEIGRYVEMFRRGETECAFHGLLEMDRDVIPELEDTFQTEKDNKIKEFLVEVIWQYRDKSVIPFLGEALYDSEPIVWRQALDGLVTLASQAALDVLQQARACEITVNRKKDGFLIWIEEAIEQVEAEIKKHA
jgi:HEAT repeat protein